ncbi:hypothetical protein HOL34_01485 [bacterium]|nr:hypothetical protein [bacterium]MBT4577449.1 hypothetical protein [bacterium]MBT5345966.1 hypothetical protein [bacterium]MBT6130752.1 hypothetical protein [bacterium]MBT6528758.1 hypothetical protein [bacterium]
MKNLNILSFLAFLLVAVQAPIFSMQKQLLTDRSTGQNVKSIVNIDTAKNRARVLQRHSVINDPNANPLRAISHQVPVANDLKKIKKSEQKVVSDLFDHEANYSIDTDSIDYDAFNLSDEPKVSLSDAAEAMAGFSEGLKSLYVYGKTALANAAIRRLKGPNKQGSQNEPVKQTADDIRASVDLATIMNIINGAQRAKKAFDISQVKIAFLNKEVASLKDQNATNKSERTLVDKRLSEQNKISEQMQNRLQAMNTNAAKLEAQLRQEVQKSKGDQTKISKRLDRLGEDLKKSQIANAKFVDRINQSKSANIGLENQLAQKNLSFTDLQTQFDELQSKLEAQLERERQSTDLEKTTTDELNRFKEQVKKLEGKNTTLENNNAQIKQDHEKQQEEHLKDKMAFQENNDALKNKIELAKQKITSTEMNVEAIKKATKARHEKDKEDIEQMKILQQEALDKQNALDDKLKAKEQENISLKNNNVAISNELELARESFRGDSKKLLELIESTKAQISKSKNKLAEQQKINEDLKSQLDGAHNTLDEQATKLAEENKKHAEREGKLEAQIKQANDANLALTKKNNEAARDQTHTYEQELAKQEAKLGREKQKNELLELHNNDILTKFNSDRAGFKEDKEKLVAMEASTKATLVEASKKHAEREGQLGTQIKQANDSNLVLTQKNLEIQKQATELQKSLTKAKASTAAQAKTAEISRKQKEEEYKVNLEKLNTKSDEQAKRLVSLDKEYNELEWRFKHNLYELNKKHTSELKVEKQKRDKTEQDLKKSQINLSAALKRSKKFKESLEDQGKRLEFETRALRLEEEKLSLAVEQQKIAAEESKNKLVKKQRLLEGLQTKLTQLEDQLGAQIKQATDTKAVLTKKNVEAQKRATELQESLTKAKDKTSQVQNATIQQKLVYEQKLDKQREKFKSEFSLMEQKSKNKAADFSALEAENKTLNKNITSLTTSAKEADKASKNKIESLNSLNAELKAKAVDKAVQVQKDIEQQKLAYNKKLASLSRQNKTLTQNNADTQKQVTRLQDSLKAVEDSLTQAQKAAEQQKQAHEQELNVKKLANRLLTSELSTAKAKLTEQGDSLNKLELENQKVIGRNKDFVNNSVLKARQAQKKIEQQNKELNAQSLINKSLTTKLNVVEQALSDKAADLNALEAEKKTLNKNVVSLTTSSEKADKATKLEIESLNSRNAELKAKAVDKAKQVQKDIKKQKLAYEQELDERRKANESTVAKLEAAEKISNEQMVNLTNLGNENKALDKKNIELIRQIVLLKKQGEDTVTQVQIASEQQKKAYKQELDKLKAQRDLDVQKLKESNKQALAAANKTQIEREDKAQQELNEQQKNSDRLLAEQEAKLRKELADAVSNQRKQLKKNMTRELSKQKNKLNNEKITKINEAEQKFAKSLQEAIDSKETSDKQAKQAKERYIQSQLSAKKELDKQRIANSTKLSEQKKSHDLALAKALQKLQFAAKDQKAKFTKELASQQKINGDQVKDLATLKTKLDKQADTLGNTESKNKTLEIEKSNLEKMIAELRAKIAQQQKSSASQISTLTQALASKSTGSNKDVQNLISIKDQKIDQLETQAKQYEQNLGNQLAISVQERKNHQQQVDTLDKQNARNITNIKRHNQQQVQQKQRRIDILERQLLNVHRGNFSEDVNQSMNDDLIETLQRQRAENQSLRTQLSDVQQTTSATSKPILSTTPVIVKRVVSTVSSKKPVKPTKQTLISKIAALLPSEIQIDNGSESDSDTESDISDTSSVNSDDAESTTSTDSNSSSSSRSPQSSTQTNTSQDSTSWWTRLLYATGVGVGVASFVFFGIPLVL